MHQPSIRPGYRVTLMVPVEVYVECRALKRAGEFAEHERQRLLAQAREEGPIPYIHSVYEVDDIEGDAKK